MVQGQRPLFSYGMNSKGPANMNLSANPPIVNVKSTMVAILPPMCCFRIPAIAPPSSRIIPTNPIRLPATTSLSWRTPQSYTTRFSSRHNQGGQITFSDGHAAYYKYSYVVSDGTAVLASGPTAGQTAAAGKDPGRADINWDMRRKPCHQLNQLIYPRQSPFSLPV